MSARLWQPEDIVKYLTSNTERDLGRALNFKEAAALKAKVFEEYQRLNGKNVNGDNALTRFCEKLVQDARASN